MEPFWRLEIDGNHIVLSALILRTMVTPVEVCGASFYTDGKESPISCQEPFINHNVVHCKHTLSAHLI